MNRVIARCTRSTTARLGLADFGKPGNYFERQIGRWSKQYQASETEPIEAMDHLIDWLPEHIPPGDGDDDRARRLPPRQPDLPPDASRASSRCSTGSSRRSAIRSPTSPTTA